MSISIPTFKVEYSAAGSSWTDVSADVEQIELVQREITAGTSTADIILNNLAGKYVSTLFPPWETETGLYYFWRTTINGKGPWYGRATDLEVNLEGSPPKETVRVQVGLHDERLKNYYLTGLIKNDILNTMIANALNQYATDLTAPTGLFTVAVTGSAPKFGSDFDCSRTRPYVHDFIRDLLTGVSDSSGKAWAGYVDSTVSATAANLNIFQQGALTYASSITYATNVNSLKNPRSILQTKNLVEFVGSLSNYEPPNRDTWTEADTFGWSALNPLTSIQTSPTHYCLETGLNQQGTGIVTIKGVSTPLCTDAASILISSGSGDTFAEVQLNVSTVLGESFNAPKRSATAVTCFLRTNGVSAVVVELQDTLGNRLVAVKQQVPVGTQQWVQFSRCIPSSQADLATCGWTQKIKSGTFDYSNIDSVNFRCQNSGGLFIDHLYFAQSYQPRTQLPDNDAIAKYTRRMAYYDASQFNTDAGLQAFAKQKLPKLSQPLFALDVTTALGPESETNGFQPGYSFPAGNVAIARYGLNLHAWRAIEVRTLLDSHKLYTVFRLTPADGPSVGVQYQNFEPRRWWSYPFRYVE